jgi:hypothetical protein
VSSVIALIVVATAAAILSYNGLRELAISAGIAPNLAWLFPIVIDGTAFAASLGVVMSVLQNMRAAYPWTLMLIAVGISIWGNVAVAPESVTARITHAIPPLMLALTLEQIARILRHKAQILHDAHPEWYTPTTPDSDQETAYVNASQADYPAQGYEQGRYDFVPEATEPEPADIVALDTREDQRPARERIIDLLDAEPDIRGAEVARRLDLDRSYATRLLREIRAERDTARPRTSPPAPVEAAQPTLDLSEAPSTGSVLDSVPQASDPFGYPLDSDPFGYQAAAAPTATSPR